jgi:collagen type VII alpha
VAGPTGPTGATGPTGLTGVTGATGATGPGLSVVRTNTVTATNNAQVAVSAMCTGSQLKAVGGGFNVSSAGNQNPRSFPTTDGTNPSVAGDQPAGWRAVGSNLGAGGVLTVYVICVP